MRPIAALPIIALALGTATAEEPGNMATVETTLGTGGGQIRQFAFDGDPDTFFASAAEAGAKDTFTLVFNRPVTLKSVAVTTGRADGSDALEAGILETSEDGTTFQEAASGQGPELRARLQGRTARALRIRPRQDLTHPLAIREIAVDSDPPVTVFRYPVEITVDVTDAPEMKEWAEKVARACERAYPMLNEELKSEGYRPATQITMTYRASYNGVAAAGGTRITGSVKYFQAHPDDVGAMVHETTHVVQRYRGRMNPGWLVEGVADYVRFFKYEPGKLGRINPERARYNGSYRVTAAFLNYVTQKYDPQLVLKLNRMMREGTYTEEAWKDLTGKTVLELDEEWRATLKS